MSAAAGPLQSRNQVKRCWQNDSGVYYMLIDTTPVVARRCDTLLRNSEWIVYDSSDRAQWYGHDLLRDTLYDFGRYRSLNRKEGLILQPHFIYDDGNGFMLNLDTHRGYWMGTGHEYLGSDDTSVFLEIYRRPRGHRWPDFSGYAVAGVSGNCRMLPDAYETRGLFRNVEYALRRQFLFHEDSDCVDLFHYRYYVSYQQALCDSFDLTLPDEDAGVYNIHYRNDSLLCNAPGMEINYFRGHRDVTYSMYDRLSMIPALMDKLDSYFSVGEWLLVLTRESQWRIRPYPRDGQPVYTENGMLLPEQSLSYILASLYRKKDLSFAGYPQFQLCPDK